MVYLISAKEIKFYYQTQKTATRCIFFNQKEKSSTRNRIHYQKQNPLPNIEFFYLMLGTQQNRNIGGILLSGALNAI